MPTPVSRGGVGMAVSRPFLEIVASIFYFHLTEMIILF